MSTTRRTGRPAATDERAIVAAALEVLGRSGFDGLTMRAVAEELGVAHTTVHRHVLSREHLMTLVLAELRERLPAQLVSEVPEIASWTDGVLLWARAVHEQASAHPGALVLLSRMRFVPDNPETHELLDRTCLLAEAAGVPLDVVFTVLSTATSHALGLAALRSVGREQPVVDRFDSDVSSLEQSHPAAGRLLRAGQDVVLDPDEQLRALVEGLAAAAGTPAR